MAETLNANPIVHRVDGASPDFTVSKAELDDSITEDIDQQEVFDLIRHINDPEHPLTLEQLNVTQLKLIDVDNRNSTIKLNFTPTIPHCSMATLIGLCLRVKLLRSLPPRFKVDVQITPGTHASEAAINKQLADKERVAAALENSALLEVVNKCIVRTDPLPNIKYPDFSPPSTLLTAALSAVTDSSNNDLPILASAKDVPL